MHNFKAKAVGIFMIVLGIAFAFIGIYFGIWLMLIDGIVEIINQLKAPQTDSGLVSSAVLRIIFFEVPILLGFWLGMISVVAGTTVLDRVK